MTSVISHTNRLFYSLTSTSGQDAAERVSAAGASNASAGPLQRRVRRAARDDGSPPVPWRLLLLLSIEAGDGSLFCGFILLDSTLVTPFWMSAESHYRLDSFHDEHF